VVTPWPGTAIRDGADAGGTHLELEERDLDVDALGDAGLQDIVLGHDLTPRKCLGFLTPLQALLKELGKDVQIRFA